MAEVEHRQAISALVSDLEGAQSECQKRRVWGDVALGLAGHPDGDSARREYTIRAEILDTLLPPLRALLAEKPRCDIWLSISNDGRVVCEKQAGHEGCHLVKIQGNPESNRVIRAEISWTDGPIVIRV